MLATLAGLLNAPALTLGPLVASRAELGGALLGVWMVLCNLRVNPLAWPLAIASSALYLLVFWEARLYGDATLQLLFIAVALWGWWQWLYGHQADGATLTVHRLSPRGLAAAAAALALLWPAIGLLLRHGTDTDVPWWDAFPTAGSIVATVLLGRKCIENWPAWVIVNVVAVGLFAYKGLWLTVGLYALFALLALVGWRAWARRLAGPA
ncbi:MAG TPA: nicotinamide riboside transporter PnuC [Methylibium sp.]|nr:nicotinamide riboside transporter PnuC [Methylibium sp.]